MSENSSEQIKREPPTELRQALAQLSNNNYSRELTGFVATNGVQEPYDLDSRMLENISNYNEFLLRQIDKSLKYDNAFTHWILLRDAGLLTPEILKKDIEEYVNKFMSLPKGTREKFAGFKGEYSNDFLQEFSSDMMSRIKQNLDWEITLEVKPKK